VGGIDILERIRAMIDLVCNAATSGKDCGSALLIGSVAVGEEAVSSGSWTWWISAANCFMMFIY
jgi:hypothetical protein